MPLPERSRRVRKIPWRTLILLSLLAAFFVAWWVMIRMPGKSFRGLRPPLSPEQAALREELAADVQMLGATIGERNLSRYPQLTAAADFIERSFAAAGFQPRRDSYDVLGVNCDNIEAELRGTGSGIVVIGAHYDSVIGAPGANDNGSGVAGVLALARRFTGKTYPHTLRFVAFVNEEPMQFQTEKMGSWVYASRCKARGDEVTAMISLETIGYFSDAPGSQSYPLPALGLIYPTTGNFITFVGDTASGGLVRRAIGTFRKHARIPSEGAALPGSVPGVGWSDHWAFWQHGYRAIMVTDTAPFRYPHYHAPTDTPEQLDYEGMAHVIAGMEKVVEDLAAGAP